MRGKLTMENTTGGFVTVMVTVYIRPFSTQEVNTIMESKAAGKDVGSLLEPHISVMHPWEQTYFMPTGKHLFMILEKDRAHPHNLEWSEAIWICHVCGIYWSPGIEEHCVSYHFRQSGSLPISEL